MMLGEAETLVFRDVAASFSKIDGLYTLFAQRCGVSTALVLVFYLLKFDDGATQKQISETCKIPKQTVNALIRQLKVDGYVDMAVGENDRREKKITLTPAGQAYAAQTLKPFLDLTKAAFKRAGVDCIHQLCQSLARLGDALEFEMQLSEVASKWEIKES